MGYRKSAIITGAIILLLNSNICCSNPVDIAKTKNTRVSASQSKAPVPNAFDYYRRAAGLLVDKKAIDNGYISPSEAVSPSVLAARRGLVLKNQKALQEFRKGFLYNYQAPELTSLDQKFPYYKGFHQIVRLLTQSASINERDGKYAAAFSNMLDVMELGADVPGGGGQLPRWIGVAFHKKARQNSWNLIDKLNTKETTEAFKRLQRIRKDTLPLYKTIEQTKVTAECIFQQRLYPKPGVAVAPDLSKLSSVEKRYILNRVSKHYDELIEYVNKPYPTMGKAPSLLGPTKNLLTVRADGISSTLASVAEPDVESLANKYASNEACNALLEASLALHAYKLQRGDYPEKLNQLSVYSNKPMLDPFAINASLKYKKTANSYLLYSIGPDGVDNGGQAIKTTRLININAKSKGDIVAGLMKM